MDLFFEAMSTLSSTWSKIFPDTSCDDEKVYIPNHSLPVMRNVNDESYAVLCLVDFFYNKSSSSLSTKSDFKLEEEFITVDNFNTNEWKFSLAWIGKKPKICITYTLDRNDKYDYKKFLLGELESVETETIQGICKERGESSRLGEMIYYNHLVFSKLPKPFCYPFDLDIGLQWSLESPIACVRPNTHSKNVQFS